MGLDIVELVMDLEREFAVEIPDERLNSVRTVGDLYRLVAEIVGEDRPVRPTADDVNWQRFSRRVIRDLGAERVAWEAEFCRDLGANWHCDLPHNDALRSSGARVVASGCPPVGHERPEGLVNPWTENRRQFNAGRSGATRSVRIA
jgi:hypothetical protein